MEISTRAGNPYLSVGAVIDPSTVGPQLVVKRIKGYAARIVVVIIIIDIIAIVVIIIPLRIYIALRRHARR
jgi:hypothetical protein